MRGFLIFVLMFSVSTFSMAQSYASSQINKGGSPATGSGLPSGMPSVTDSTLTDTLPLLNKDLVPLTIKIPVKTAPVGSSPKNLLAFPFVVKSLETNWGFGGVVARFFRLDQHDSTVRTSDVNVLGLYTLKKQLILALTSTLYLPKEDQIIRFQASYSYYPNKFWGLGNHTSFDAEESYSQKQFFFNPQYLRRIHRKMYVGLSYQFQHTSAVSYAPGGLFDKENITGRYGGYTSGIGPILSWDTRNSAFSPTRGVLAEMQYIWFNKAFGSNFNFTVFNLDFRKFFYLSEKSVLGFQGIAGLTSGNTPFRYLELLGGSDMMRGYYGGRFSDKCLMAYQAEYRRFLFWRIGAVAFASTGEVSPDLAHFDLNGFHYAYGGGLRFMLSKQEKLNLRIDYGIGRHSTAFNVQVREAF